MSNPITFSCGWILEYDSIDSFVNNDLAASGLARLSEAHGNDLCKGCELPLYLGSENFLYFTSNDHIYLTGDTSRDFADRFKDLEDLSRKLSALFDVPFQLNKTEARFEARWQRPKDRVSIADYLRRIEGELIPGVAGCSSSYKLCPVVRCKTYLEKE